MNRRIFYDPPSLKLRRAGRKIVEKLSTLDWRDPLLTNFGKIKQMKSLKFAPQLVPLILKGEKTITWRLFDDKNLQEGDLVHFLNSGTTKEFATAKLIKVVSKKMREVDDEDFDGHEKFTSQEQMYETYSNYYNKQITPETVVKVVKFKLL